MSNITPIEPNEIITPPEGPSGPLGYTVSNDNYIEQFSLIVSNVIGFFTMIAGFAFLFYFAFAAVAWITSGDDQQKLTNARKSMTQALIGILITAAAYPLVWLITYLLGIPLDNPAEIFNSFFK